MAVNITLTNFADEVLHCDKTVLADFYADWCGPCKMQAPILEEFEKENANIKCVKINTEENLDLSMTYGIMSIPTLIVFKDGKEVNRALGVRNKNELRAFVDEK